MLLAVSGVVIESTVVIAALVLLAFLLRDA
jgi:hypothetical protein